jgi:putative nucleotidyltransferase with HDIG domain
MRYQDQIVIDDDEMEDFLLFRCSKAHAEVLCQHFLKCDECNERLEFNRFFLQMLKSGFHSEHQVIPASSGPWFDPVRLDASAFYICPEGLHRLRLAGSASTRDIAKAARSLGVFDESARRTTRLASQPEVTQRQLAAVVEADPVLASLMIQFANSPLFGSAQRITTLPHAISFVGIEPTRQLLLGIVMRRFVGRDREAWAHAVAVAQAAEAIAALSEPVDPSVAFLAGLVHDIGRLIFGSLPREKREVIDLLHARGCPLGHAETLLLGMSHAEAGATYLAGCRFEESVIEAVRSHHKPGDTSLPLANVVFLAEYLSGSEEDSMSGELVESACQRIAIAPRDLNTLEPKRFSDLLLAA